MADRQGNHRPHLPEQPHPPKRAVAAQALSGQGIYRRRPQKKKQCVSWYTIDIVFSAALRLPPIAAPKRGQNGGTRSAAIGCVVTVLLPVLVAGCAKCCGKKCQEYPEDGTTAGLSWHFGVGVTVM